MGKRIQTIALGETFSAITRPLIALGYQPLRFYVERGLSLDVLVDADAPTVLTALYVADIRDGGDVPTFCGRHLGSTGCLHLFEVDLRSPESR